MSWGRGQGSVEYLVVFGAVLVISAVVVSSLGSMPSMANSAREQQTLAAWRTALPFSISAFKLSSTETSLTVTDSAKKGLKITQVYFGNGENDAQLWVPDGSQSQLFVTGSYTATLSNTSFDFPGNPCYNKPLGAEFEFANVIFVYTDDRISGIRQTGPALAGQCSANTSGVEALGATPTPSAEPSAAPSVEPTPSAEPSAEPTPSPSPSPVSTPNPIEFIFFVADADGSNVAAFTYNGDIVLKGGCYAGASGSCANPPADSFVVQDDSGVAHAYINTSGSLCIEDSDCGYGDASCANPPADSFIMQATSGTNATYISPSGALCMIGTLHQYGTP